MEAIKDFIQSAIARRESIIMTNPPKGVLEETAAQAFDAGYVTSVSCMRDQSRPLWATCWCSSVGRAADL